MYVQNNGGAVQWVCSTMAVQYNDGCSVQLMDIMSTVEGYHELPGWIP